jgi:hypothetical protein
MNDELERILKEAAVASVRMAGAPAENRTDRPPNIRVERYRYVILLCDYIKYALAYSSLFTFH